MRRSLGLLFAFFLCSIPATTFANPEIDSILTISESRDFFFLNFNSRLLKDETGKLKLEDVMSRDFDFHRITEEIYGLRDDKNVPAYWLKFTVQNKTGNTLHDLVCLQPGVDSVEQYVFNPDGTMVHSAIASYQKTRTRYLFISRELALPVEVQPGTTTIYLRLLNKSVWSQERGNILLSLVDENSFVNYFLESRFYQGAALGMLFLIFILHIFIYLFFKDVTYLIYMINILLTLIYLLLRKNYQLEFDFLSPVFGYTPYLHDPIDFLLVLTAVWFCQSFLNTKVEDPIIHRIMNVLKIALATGCILTLTLNILEVMNIISLYISFLGAIVILTAAIRSFRRGNKLALYVFFGFVPLAFVMVIYAFPSADYLHFRSNESDFHYFGEALRAVIFSIGITDRFYQFKKAAMRAEFEKEQLKFDQEKQIQSEKERISRDLHDNIGSQLAVLSLDLGSLSQEYGENSKIAEARESTRHIIEELRDTVWAIESNIVTLDNIETKLHTLMLSYRRRISDIEFKLDIPDNIKFLSVKPSQAINMYRIIQEAILNSVRHGRCSIVEVTFSYSHSSKTLKLTVSDNGTGFNIDPEQIDSNTHHGIKNMKKRAVEMNGQLEIINSETKGVTVTLSLGTL